MYSTCLFCHTKLGNNEALEHMPVGRRIAYDCNTGRLWVICRQCQRWNLSPIETRWEAMEDAERAFSTTRLRVSTDNIALAQLREGLELVRIGKPPRLEMAGWRYGNMFASRWRKHALYVAGGAGLFALATVGQFGTLFLPGTLQLSLLGSGSILLYQGVNIGRSVRDRRQIRFHVRDDEDNVIGLTRANAMECGIRTSPNGGEWWLEFPYRGWNGRYYTETRTGKGYIRGASAERALGIVLPFLNRAGAREGRVREAIDVIDNYHDLRQLFSREARPPEWKEAGVKRWREAEEIGRIADGLT